MFFHPQVYCLIVSREAAVPSILLSSKIMGRGGKVGEQGGWKQGDKVEGYCNNAVRFDGDQLGRGGQAVVEVVKNWLDSRCIFNVSQRDFVIAGYVV